MTTNTRTVLVLKSTGQTIYPLPHVKSTGLNRDGYLQVLRPFLPHEGKKGKHKGEVLTVRASNIRKRKVAI